MSEENKLSIKIFNGTIIHCSKKLQIEIIENAYITVKDAKIIFIESKTDFLKRTFGKNDEEIIRLKKNQILIPGLIDTHIHGNQYPNCGLGYDKTLLDWLQIYTIKLEKMYKDLKFSKIFYDQLVRKSLDCGTTTACYFGSLFTDSTIVLVDSVIEFGQRALIGKINMIKSPSDDYVETVEESRKNTMQFLQYMFDLKNDLVEPIITPRFALSMDMNYMRELAQIAANFNLKIQTHISENVDEVEAVEKMYGLSSYAKVYDEAHLLTNRTILAHGIYLSDEELKLISERKSAISHCADSNTCLKSGFCDVRKLINFNIKVGLGSDVSGGSSPSIIKTMKSTLDTSVHLSFINNSNNYKPLNFAEVFYLATLGGAEALGLEKKIGNFEIGKEFDALVIDVKADVDGNLLIYSPQEILEKFIYCGDDRNVIKVFVAGKEVKN